MNGVDTYNPRSPKACQQTAAAGRGKEGFSPRTSDFQPQTSDLQNWTTINFCCFKPPSFWYFITAALEPNTFMKLRFNFYLYMVSFSSLDFNLLKASYVYFIYRYHLQYFGHLMQTAHSLEKTLMLRKIEGKRRNGRHGRRWLDSITDSMDMNMSKLREIVEDREAWRVAVHEVTKSWTWLSKWTTTIYSSTDDGIWSLLAVKSLWNWWTTLWVDAWLMDIWMQSISKGFRISDCLNKPLRSNINLILKLVIIILQVGKEDCLCIINKCLI